MSPVSGILHLVVATLRDNARHDGVERAVARARDLRSAPGVVAVLTGHSEDQLVVATWLVDREALDEFAASAAHMAFVMQGLAPVIHSMWSAAVETDASPPSARPSYLWAFALPEREGVYEWQVRQLLAEIEGLPGAAATGPTVEERERFRAGGVVILTASDDEFAARLSPIRGKWLDIAGAIDEALVPVPVLPE